MAESFIQVPPDSSGKKAHTFAKIVGANTVEDEIVTLGDQYLATYVALSGSGISAATAAAHLMQIMAGAALNVYIRRIKITQVVGATAAAMNDILLVRLSTAGTGGTAVTPGPYDSTDAASGATAMTLPTVKGTEGVGLWRESCYMIQTIPASGSLTTGVIFDWDCDRLRTKPIRIPAGIANGLAIKANTAIAAATVTVAILFNEANF